MQRQADPRVLAHLSYTTLFESIVPTTVVVPMKYGKLYAVHGAAGPLTFLLPASSYVNKANGEKDTAHVAVVNCDGAFQINVATSDAKQINFSGNPAIVNSGEPGAFAIFFWSNEANMWIAMQGCCTPPG